MDLEDHFTFVVQDYIFS